jgi:pyruvate, orthophosphate dikinase
MKRYEGVSSHMTAGFAVAAGIVTAVGARTAQAALVTRQMGNPASLDAAA